MAVAVVLPLLAEDAYPLGRDQLYDKLKANGIYGRRYFYPWISEFPMYRGLPSVQAADLSVASHISKRIICLPIYPALSDDDRFRLGLSSRSSRICLRTLAISARQWLPLQIPSPAPTTSCSAES